ncbi:MAG: hypothetical protein OXU20_30535 [Myxococcales bacterium]|nr:hypothetical protein [Myxococcales bacterium]
MRFAQRHSCMGVTQFSQSLVGLDRTDDASIHMGGGMQSGQVRRFRVAQLLCQREARLL